nr:hypothetical protein [uncultured Rhodopila sp.]
MTNISQTCSEDYTFSQFILPGQTFAVAYGINDLGAITGAGNVNGFILNQGTVTEVQVPFSYPVPLAINNPGQVAGFFPKSDGSHAFIDTNGTITYFASLPSSFVNDARASGINDLGQVVGQYKGLTGTVPETITAQFGFIDIGGTLTTLTLADGTGFLPTGINDFDQIVGTTTAGVSGVLDLKTDTFKTIDVPGAASTDATAINNLGQVAGTYTDSSGVVHGFVDTYGHFTFLDPSASVPGTLEAISAINDFGQVIGQVVSNYVTESFVGSPVKPGGLLADLIPALPPDIEQALLHIGPSLPGGSAVNLNIGGVVPIPPRFDHI